MCVRMKNHNDDFCLISFHRIAGKQRLGHGQAQAEGLPAQEEGPDHRILRQQVQGRKGQRLVKCGCVLGKSPALIKT